MKTSVFCAIVMLCCIDWIYCQSVWFLLYGWGRLHNFSELHKFTFHWSHSLTVGSFRVKSPNFQEIPHDPSDVSEKITKNTLMCSNDRNKILDPDHY